MSRKRMFSKYAVAGAVTALYGAAVFKSYRDPDLPKASPEKVAIAAGLLSGLTWIAAAL